MGYIKKVLRKFYTFYVWLKNEYFIGILNNVLSKKSSDCEYYVALYLKINKEQNDYTELWNFLCEILMFSVKLNRERCLKTLS